MLVAGIMSGTSLDGIDVAVIDIHTSRRFHLSAVSHGNYSPTMKERILAVSNAQTHTAEISRLNFELGELYAKQVITCCKKAKIPLTEVKLIGCHGQTIYHEGGRNTLQIGEAAVIAERTGIDVVSNFRERDIAAGGQGAPLVPIVDFLLYRHGAKGRIALNLGGIANITAIPANATIDDVVAFDTGPANMIIDQLMTRFTDGKKTFDRNGAVARKGTLNKPLLAELMRAPYFQQKPPKSAGREQYGKEFVDSLVATGIPLQDLITTATHFTAETIALAIRQLPQGRYREVIAGGGGACNGFLLDLIEKATGLELATTAYYGIDVAFKEAAAFAVLAWQSIHGEPGNVRTATGARRGVVLGKLTRA